jgi:hypothetical protein
MSAIGQDEEDDDAVTDSSEEEEGGEEEVYIPGEHQLQPGQAQQDSLLFVVAGKNSQLMFLMGSDQRQKYFPISAPVFFLLVF